MRWGKLWVDKVGVKGDEMGKIVDKAVNQAHMAVGVNTGKLYPVTAEHLVIGEINSEVQGNSKEDGYQYNH